MGNFYTNITLRTNDQDSVVDYLNRASRSAFVSPVYQGYVCVFDEVCDSQDDREISALSSALSKRLKCPAIAVLNHDDDIFWYQVYDNGVLVDSYDSCPGYFAGAISGGPGGSKRPVGGNPAKLCQLFVTPEDRQEEIRAILSGPATFAVERHMALFETLGLPTFSVGAGYNYIEEGDCDSIWDEFDADREEDDDFDEYPDIEDLGFVRTPSDKEYFGPDDDTPSGGGKVIPFRR